MNSLILVNQQNPLCEDYIPKELIQDGSTQIWIRKDVYQAFYKMNAAIKDEGLTGLVLVSGYRSYDYQQKVFNRKVSILKSEGLTEKDANDKAKKVVALPGTSEHQTGLAIDLTNINLAQESDPLVEKFEKTDHGRWLDSNAHDYGFILRYPKEKTKITHIIYEPWHYRYVGIYHAKRIKKLKICLEEYILYLNKNNI